MLHLSFSISGQGTVTGRTPQLCAVYPPQTATRLGGGCLCFGVFVLRCFKVPPPSSSLW